jgi:hypothetical protein
MATDAKPEVPDEPASAPPPKITSAFTCGIPEPVLVTAFSTMKPKMWLIRNGHVGERVQDPVSKLDRSLFAPHGTTTPSEDDPKGAWVTWSPLGPGKPQSCMRSELAEMFGRSAQTVPTRISWVTHLDGETHICGIGILDLETFSWTKFRELSYWPVPAHLL